MGVGENVKYTKHMTMTGIFMTIMLVGLLRGVNVTLLTTTNINPMTLFYVETLLKTISYLNMIALWCYMLVTKKMVNPED